MTAPRKVVTLRGMARFSCIGAACEAHCCGGWKVHVDEAHFHRLERLLPADELARKVQRAGGPRNKRQFASLELQPDGNCSFLDESRLCSLQARFGESILPDVCSMYPRVMSAVGQRLEVFGMLSCPEVARLSLLTDDGVDLVDLPEDKWPTRGALREVHDRQKTPWMGALDVVRGAMYRTLRRRELPLRLRAHALTTFAHTTRSWLNVSAKGIDPEQLQFELECLDNPEILAEQARTFREAPLDPSLAAAIGARTLAAMMEMGVGGAPFLGLLAEVFGEGTTVTPQKLFEVDLAHVRASTPELRQLTDRWLTNLAVEGVMRQWFTSSGDLVAYLHSLLVRLTLVRVFLWGHPRLRAALEIADETARVRALEEAAVSIVYRTLRGLEHGNLREELETAFFKHDLLSPAHSLSLVQYLVV